MKPNISLLFFTFLCGTLFAQTFDIGLNPHRQKWQQINTDTTRIIFPVGLEKSAQNLANLIHLQARNTTSVGKRLIKYPIILHNQTAIPNGFVATAPFRSEYYMTPPQFSFSGANSWQNLLSIHEFRHIQQNSNAKVGVTKLSTYIFGEYGWMALMGTALPRWYKEGDAVLTETLLTNAGRGRQPFFEKEYRALLLNSQKYNYEKAAAGSYRDFVPDFYRMGYYMTTFARRKFGEDIWTKTLDKASRYDAFFYPFSVNLKRHTGLTTKKLYRNTFQEMDSLWRIQDKKLKLTESSALTPKQPRVYTEYRNPHFWTNEKIVSEKTSFNHIRKFVLSNKNGKEEILFNVGINPYFNRSLSIENQKMIWAETRYHERWRNVQYSVLMLYDLEKKIKRQLTKKSRYFAPALSKDASKIVAVRVSENQSYSLHILDTKTGKIVHQISNQKNDFYSFPTWTESGEIVVIMQNSEGNRLVKINPETQKVTDLVRSTNLQISNPVVSGNYVFFSGAFTKINNIFAIQLNTPNHLFQVTSVRFGAFQPAVSPDGETLVFSDFDAKGYSLQKMKIEAQKWQKFHLSDAVELDYFKPLLTEGYSDITTKLEHNKYKVSKFKKSYRLFNLHSVSYLPLHPNYSLKIHFQNFFSTILGSVRGIYNVNEKQFTYLANFDYGKFYPVFNFGVSHADRLSYVMYPSFENPEQHTWSETSAFLGIKFPFNLSSGVSTSLLQIATEYKYLNLSYADKILDLTRGGYLNTANFELIFNRLQTQAKRNIYPKFGVNLYAQGQTTFAENFNSGSRIYLEGGFYLPSILPNHGFYFSGGYRKEAVLSAYRFQDNFILPRGYLKYFSNEVYRLSGNYGMPLACPDWALGSLVFLQRIKLYGFYDFSKYNNFNQWYLQRSFGTEVRFDFRFLRLLDIDLGIRYSRLLDPNPLIDNTESRIEIVFFRIGA